MENNIFRKKTLRRIHTIENLSIWISIHKENKEQNKKRNFDREGRENHAIK